LSTLRDTLKSTLADRQAYHYNRKISYYDYAEGSLSCNIWKEDTVNNEQALHNKLDWYSELLDLRAGNRVCEVGCGLGKASEYLSSKVVCDIDAITISKEQAGKKDLDRVKYIHSDWKDWEGQYDKVYSDGCLVHAKGCQQEFFDKMYSLTKPGGICLVKEMFHTEPLIITREQCKFISETFKFSGEYKSIRENVEWAEKAGFKVTVHKIPIENYVKTMTRWQERMRYFKEEMLAIDAEQYQLDYLTWTTYMEMMRQGSVEVGVLVCQTQ
jgi:cyclopropane fatty-acyl-phospholipid synthase-like methyltransferase